MNRPTICRKSLMRIGCCQCLNCTDQADRIAPMHAYHHRGPRQEVLVNISGWPADLSTLTPTQLRHMARRMVEIANDGDEGVDGHRTYGVPSA